MGIKKLNEFIREECKRLQQEVVHQGKLSELYGKTIAVDMGNLISTFLPIARKEVIQQTNVCEGDPPAQEIVHAGVRLILNRLIVFLRQRINPILCFDGKADPLKEKTWIERSKNDDKQRIKIESLRERIRAAGPLDRVDDLIKEYIKIYPSIKESGLKGALGKELREIATTLGFHCLTAGKDGPEMNGEAETLCAHLCINGIAEYTYSTDSDLLAYGVNMIKSMSGKWTRIQGESVHVWEYESVSFPAVLRLLGFKHYRVFRDFCIMCGTDYNDNIKNIGVKRAHAFFMQGKRLRDLSEDQRKHLNYKQVRKIFLSAQVESIFTSKDFTLSGILPDDVGEKYAHLPFMKEILLEYAVAYASYEDDIARDVEIPLYEEGSF